MPSRRRHSRGRVGRHTDKPPISAYSSSGFINSPQQFIEQFTNNQNIIQNYENAFSKISSFPDVPSVLKVLHDDAIYLGFGIDSTNSEQKKNVDDAAKLIKYFIDNPFHVNIPASISSKSVAYSDLLDENKKFITSNIAIDKIEPFFSGGYNPLKNIIVTLLASNTYIDAAFRKTPYTYFGSNIPIDDDNIIFSIHDNIVIKNLNNIQITDTFDILDKMNNLSIFLKNNLPKNITQKLNYNFAEIKNNLLQLNNILKNIKDIHEHFNDFSTIKPNFVRYILIKQPLPTDLNFLVGLVNDVDSIKLYYLNQKIENNLKIYLQLINTDKNYLNILLNLFQNNIEPIIENLYNLYYESINMQKKPVKSGDTSLINKNFFASNSVDCLNNLYSDLFNYFNELKSGKMKLSDLLNDNLNKNDISYDAKNSTYSINQSDPIKPLIKEYYEIYSKIMCKIFYFQAVYIDILYIMMDSFKKNFNTMMDEIKIKVDSLNPTDSKEIVSIYSFLSLLEPELKELQKNNIIKLKNIA